MESYFYKIKDLINELDLEIIYEDDNDEVFVIRDEDEYIDRMVIGCADPILVIEQYICEIGEDNPGTYKKLLQKNREIVHGALVLDSTGTKLIYRDTLQIEHIDLNELEASINSLKILLSEFSDEIIRMSKKKELEFAMM
jgi:hypothetical protein